MSLLDYRTKTFWITFIIAYSLIMWGIVSWADWCLQSIWNKDFNNWAIFGCLAVLEYLTPKSAKGWTTLSLMLMTIYIWIN